MQNKYYQDLRESQHSSVFPDNYALAMSRPFTVDIALVVYYEARRCFREKLHINCSYKQCKYPSPSYS